MIVSIFLFFVFLWDSYRVDRWTDFYAKWLNRVANSQISLTRRWGWGAAGVKGGGEWGGGVPLPSRLGGLGERRKLPQRGPERSPGRNQFLVHFNLKRTHLTTTYLVFSDISDITCTENDWKIWDIGIGDRQQSKNLAQYVFFRGLCECSFCLVVLVPVVCACYITASLYIYLYFLWGIEG